MSSSAIYLVGAKAGVDHTAIDSAGANAPTLSVTVDDKLLAGMMFASQA